MLFGAILAVLLCAPPSLAVVVPADATWTIYYAIPGDYLEVYGTAKLDPGANIEYGVYAYGGSTIEIRGGTIGEYGAVQVFAGPPAATVTVYGTDFDVSSGTIEPDGSWTPSGGSGTLTGEYGNGDPISLLFYSDIPIQLSAPGTTNQPPEAIAGQEGLTGAGGKIHPIYSNEQSATSVMGEATDPEEQPIEYRWLEGSNVLLDWTAVISPSQAYLDLSTLSAFAVGDHTLTLEVRETTGDMLEASDDMTLRILPAPEPPEITEITIEPTPLGSPTAVSATFIDSDGGTHTATVRWKEVGTAELGAVNEMDMTVTGANTYTATGVYTVTVTITDQDGAEATATAYAAVYDPDAYSFVTGSGWIPDEGSRCGKAFFGVFCRQWGGGDPGGRMRFRWGENNRFHATEFDYLVVSEDRTTAWFAGVGTLNGEGGQYFMAEVNRDLDAIDLWILSEPGYDTGDLVDLGRGRIRIRQSN